MSEKPLTVDALLKLRYQYPEWLVINEATYAERRVDALAVNLWPSAGFYVHGFEIKATRSDWLRELADVTKSEPIRQQCHRFWLVAPKEVASVDELPVGWGWLQIQGSRLRAVRQAKEQKRVSLSPSFVARVCAKACQQSPVVAQMQARIDRLVAQTNASLSELVEERLKYHKQDLERYKSAANSLWAFQRATGIHLDGSTLGDRELRAVKTLLAAGDASRAALHTEQALKALGHVLRDLEKCHEVLASWTPVVERVELSGSEAVRMHRHESLPYGHELAGPGVGVPALDGERAEIISEPKENDTDENRRTARD